MLLFSLNSFYAITPYAATKRKFHLHHRKSLHNHRLFSIKNPKPYFDHWDYLFSLWRCILTLLRRLLSFFFFLPFLDFIQERKDSTNFEGFDYVKFKFEVLYFNIWIWVWFHIWFWFDFHNVVVVGNEGVELPNLWKRKEWGWRNPVGFNTRNLHS